MNFKNVQMQTRFSAIDRNTHLVNLAVLQFYRWLSIKGSRLTEAVIL